MVPNTLGGVGSLAGVGSLSTLIDQFGYFASGSWSGSQNTTVDKFSMVSETGSVLAATFPPSGGYRLGGASMSNNDVAGYGTTGRGSGNPSTAIWKLLFAAGTTSTLSGTFPLAFPAHVTGATNPGTAGYTFGGYSSTGPNVISTIYKMPYSTETFASVGNATTPLYVASAVSNHGVSVIQVGGLTNSNTFGTDSNKVSVSTDTVSRINQSVGYGWNPAMAGASNSGSAGYFFGGFDSGATSFASSNHINRVLKIAYSTETSSRQDNILSAAISRSTTTSRTGQNAFLTLGNSSTGVNKYNYSTQTASVSSYSTSVSHDYAFSFSNSA